MVVFLKQPGQMIKLMDHVRLDIIQVIFMKVNTRMVIETDSERCILHKQKGHMKANGLMDRELAKESSFSTLKITRCIRESSTMAILMEMESSHLISTFIGAWFPMVFLMDLADMKIN